MSLNRVTTQGVSTSALRGLQASLARSQDLQAQLSSGRRIQRPSDDAAGTVAAMRLRSERIASEQYADNAFEATARLNVTDSTLSSMGSALQSARDLVVNSSNGALSPSGRAALAAQIKAIKDDVVGLMNTTHLGRPIFGGTTQGEIAVNATTGAYVGDDQPVEVRIGPTVMMRVDATGTQIGADTLASLLDRIAANMTNNQAAQPTDLSDLDVALDKVIQTRGDVGARQARVSAASTALASKNLDYTAQISEREDIDIPETVTKLASQQTAYELALKTAARITQTSLLDYIR